MPDGSAPPEPVISSTIADPAELVRSEEPTAKPHDVVVFKDEQPSAPTGTSTMTYVGIGAIVALVAMVFYVVR